MTVCNLTGKHEVWDQNFIARVKESGGGEGELISVLAAHRQGWLGLPPSRIGIMIRSTRPAKAVAKTAIATNRMMICIFLQATGAKDRQVLCGGRVQVTFIPRNHAHSRAIIIREFQNHFAVFL